jgi:hypothetical protein
MNWITERATTKISTVDKTRALLKMSYKLILVHADEMLRLKTKNNYKDIDIKFVNLLYEHYIVNGLGKNEFYNLKIN